MPEDRTVFDINKPSSVGASPNSRPVIASHHPITHDPMVRKFAPAMPKKIEINDRSLPENIQPSFENLRPEPKYSAPPPKPRSSPVATLDGETYISPTFGQSDFNSNPDPTPKKSPYMPTSALTSVASNVPASSLVDAKAVDNGPSISGAKVLSGRDNTNTLSHKKPKRHFRLWWLSIPLVMLAGFYLALDSGVLPNTFNLPLHIFNKSEKTADSSASTPTSPSSNLPEGFSKYNLAATNLYFASPTAWGVPTVTTDDGFTKRGNNNPADGKYAYITSFPNNKDIEVIFISSKYLPPARTAMYYDFLQWCIGTNDGNYYQSALRYTTLNGVDTPATISCDQGPLAGVAKLDSNTIVEKGAKTSDGKDFGDLYIKNLTDKNMPVVRVRDATMKNSDAITTMLGNISFSSSAQ